jgi:opacity protein-like surface antigen
MIVRANRCILIAAAAIAAALSAPAAFANGDIPVMRPAPPPAPMRMVDPQAQGNKEIEVAAGFFHSEGSDVGSISGDVGFGYYVAPRLSLGIRQTLSYNFIDDAPDTWLASTIPFVEYSFGQGNVRPFLGAFVGGIYNDDEGTGTAGPSAGLRWYLNDSTAVVGRYRYEWFFDDIAIKDATDTRDGNHVVTVGLSFSWQ